MAVSGGRMTELEVINKLRRDEHREASRDRTKVWTEPASRKSKSDQKVPVVYYISRNGQLDHPHFMEVPLSSPKGLFLNDVIGRLSALRGKGMPAMYTWSCKRSYKNGYVWHDLSDNDFIYPAHAHEYVLKGSELLIETVHAPPPENQINTISDAGYRRGDQSSRSSYTDSDPRECSSVYNAQSSFRSAAEASAKKDDGRRRRRRPVEIVEEKIGKKSQPEVRDEIEISPPPSDSSVETLRSLLKADERLEMVNKESRVKFDRRQIQKATKSSVLMQLISCGSLSFKGGGAGQVISRYRMRVRPGSGGGVRVEVEGE